MDNEIIAMNRAIGSDVTQDDYQAWLEPDGKGDPDKFDAAVRKVLGDELYDAADVCARLDSVWCVKMGGTIRPQHEHDLALAIIANPSAYRNGF